MNDSTSFIVYKHTSPSGKVYIGITQQEPGRRFRPNGSGYKNNKYFWHAIKKYGWSNFKHEILYSGISKEIACAVEIELIEKHNSTNKEHGYNISFGGEHTVHSEETRKKISEAMYNLSPEVRKKISKSLKGRVMPEETRKKISESFKGHVMHAETRRKLSNAHKGHVHSEATRKKMSEIKKGHTVSEYTRKKLMSENVCRKRNANIPKRPVVCVETGIVYESARVAQRQTGINQSSISKVCNDKLKTAGGLHWKFYNKNLL